MHSFELREDRSTEQRRLRGCLAMGDTWVHLRLCAAAARRLLRQLEEQARHKHFGGTRHPIITSLERGEDWSWCYVDELELLLE